MVRVLRMALGWLVISTFAMTGARGVAQTLRDDFSQYPAGSDGTPAWEPQSVGWEIRDGSCFGDTGATLWRAAAFGKSVTFACDVTVLATLPGDWLTAGIGLCADDANYWGVNLVAAPVSQQRRHATELHESLAGHWLAESLPDTRLEHLPGHGGQFDWQLNQTYRFEISLTAEAVIARISSGGKEVARFGCKLTGGIPAVRAGRPVLRANGLRVRFDNATVTIQQTAPEPVVEKPSFPAWVSRPGKSVAKGAGFFRTAEVGGRWWLVDPEGKPFFDVGTDHVSYHSHWCEALGYAPYHRNVAAKFGNEDAWAASAAERLKAWGFNTLPAGHSKSMRHRGLAHILFASFGSGFARREWIAQPIHWTGFPDVFSPRWPSYCRFTARKLAQESRGDPWCIGTFLDNELEWYGKKGQLVDEVFQLAPDAPAKNALLNWLLKRWDTLGAVNRQLGTQYRDAQAFLTSTNVPPASAGLTETRDGFLAEIAERYFRVAASAMREADPDHLVLGCRFAGRAPGPALLPAGRYNDVFTFNTYPRVDFDDTWAPDGRGGVVQRVPRELTEMYQVVRKPMIITEWSFPALDSGLPCQHGAGMRVDTQAQKAACYRIFANAMSDLPFMVGYHYFMWADQPAPGISSTFPEDSNYGLVNEKDEPYRVLTATATEVNRAAAGRHARSAFSGDLAVHVTGDAVELSNTNAMPSRAWLRITAAGKSRIEGIALEPKGKRRVPVAAQGAWCAELQQWDGLKTRFVGGTALGPLQVANASAGGLTNVPVVLDGPPLIAAVISRLAPGQTATLAAPTAEMADQSRLEVSGGGTTWICERRDGSLFDAIRAGDLPLGRLVFAAHQQRDGHDFWTEATRVVSLRAQRQSGATVVEAVVERGARGGMAFRAGVRAVVFHQGGLALLKPLWIENTDQQPWRLLDAFWFCRPAIGGSPNDDVIGGPAVPNYYRAAQFFTDRKLGGCFGVADQTGGWHVTFWKDDGGSLHPDARLSVERELRPGERWNADEAPYLWVYARRDADGWRELSHLCRQAATGLLTRSNR